MASALLKEYSPNNTNNVSDPASAAASVAPSDPRIIDRPFGVEYETCVICDAGPAHDWITNLNSYVAAVRTRYNSVPPEWTGGFKDTVYILDDTNNLFQFNLQNHASPQKITDNADTIESLIHTYTIPLITMDSTVICHNTLRRAQAENFDLTQENYTINVEIVSQILYSRSELDYFMNLFIIKEKFVVNKSQGVHLNISVKDMPSDSIRQIVKSGYKPWENAWAPVFRPQGSKWAQPLTNAKMAELNDPDAVFNTVFGKTNSIRYKTGPQILEFRILTPIDDLKDRIVELLDMFPPTTAGGKRSTKRKYQQKRAKTRKHPKTAQIFVYGSLRKGLQNHHRLTSIGAKYMGIFKSNKPYYMVGLKSRAYPYITDTKVSSDSNKTPITGEVYRIKRTDLKELDALEHNYVRKLEGFHGPKKTKAYVYVLENDELIEGIKSSFTKRFVSVPEGDWIAFNEKN